MECPSSSYLAREDLDHGVNAAAAIFVTIPSRPIQQRPQLGAGRLPADHRRSAGVSAGGLEVGLVLPLFEQPESSEKPSWRRIATMAESVEAMGLDTVWIADELLWRIPDWPGPRGWWECVSIAGAVAATTSTIGVGTWVLSALHRNPRLTVKVAETIDEISGGRFVFGLGAGHAG
jgi:hypothetical protein